MFLDAEIWRYLFLSVLSPRLLKVPRDFLGVQVLPTESYKLLLATRNQQGSKADNFAVVMVNF